MKPQRVCAGSARKTTARSQQKPGSGTSRAATSKAEGSATHQNRGTRIDVLFQDVLDECKTKLSEAHLACGMLLAADCDSHHGFVRTSATTHSILVDFVVELALSIEPKPATVCFTIRPSSASVVVDIRPVAPAVSNLTESRVHDWMVKLCASGTHLVAIREQGALVLIVELPLVSEVSSPWPLSSESHALEGLVVDGEGSARTSLSAYLRAKGCLVDEAEDGLQGWGMLRSRKYDFVVVDLLAPHINGLELLRRMRKLRPRPASVLLGAWKSAFTESIALNLGASGCYVKPIRPQVVLGRIRRAIRNQLARESSTGSG